MTRFENLPNYAWKVELTPPDDRSTHDSWGCLARWNIVMPGHHPLWSRYSLNLIHLRDIPGQETPVHKREPHMTHEIVVFAIDPEYPEEKFQDGGIALLTPVNHSHQFAATDPQAQKVARHMAEQLILNRQLPEPSGITGAREHFTNEIERYLSDEA